LGHRQHLLVNDGLALTLAIINQVDIGVHIVLPVYSAQGICKLLVDLLRFTRKLAHCFKLLHFHG
jgi:hypothetical protein